MTRIYTTKKYAQYNQEIVKGLAQLKETCAEKKISSDVRISQLSMFSLSTSQALINANSVQIFEKLLQDAQGKHFKGIEWSQDKITIYSQHDTKAKYAIRDYVESLNIPVENVSGRYYFHVRMSDIYDLNERLNKLNFVMPVRF